MLDLVEKPAYFCLRLVRVFVLQQHFDKRQNGVADVHLDEAELLVAFVLQNLAKKSNVMVFPQVRFYPINYGSCPLNDQVLEPVPLVQIGVHVLLHRLAWELVIFALFVKADLLGVNVVDHVLELLQGESPLLGHADWAL